ncbi:GDSL-type esterase/lipase family protein [Enterobacter ludwigii]|uniref:SGNH/GDSL hydrolase family protein n=1 Tax=Enterobacter ludwigii TaxID=299767 RepID=UPI003D6DE50D
MTVSTVVDHNDYTGNGVTTSFPYAFRIFNKADLSVSVIDLSENITVLVLDTDYTVTNAGGYNGGDVVLTSPLANGWQISIARELEPTQETDLRNQGKFFAEVHEDAFDKLTMLIQQVSSMFRLALRKPSSIANWYDALNNYIRNLRDPRDPQDAATKNYVDAISSTNFSKTLRVPEPVNQLPAAADRANKIPAFDFAGNPVVVLPPSGSASDVLIEMLKPTGTNLMRGTKSATGASPRLLTDMLSDFITLQDFSGKDDYNGTTGTNNLTPFSKAFTYLNSMGGGILRLVKSPGGTGKYFINGDDSTPVTSPVRIVADDGVSIHIIYSGGAANSPLVNTGLQANRQIKIQYINFGFTSYIGKNVQSTLGENLPTLCNSDGVFSYPVSINGTTDLKILKLSNTNVAVAPVSSASDSIVMAGGGVPTVASISASVGDEIMSLISSPSSGVFLAGVITANGYAYFAQDTGTLGVKLVDGTNGLPGVVKGVPYALMDQQRDLFNNSLITVKITSSRSFSVLVNGLSMGSYTTRSGIISACFGSENINDNISVSQMAKVNGRSFSGAKPLKIIMCGDSITDNNVQYSHAKYLQMILGSAGVNIAEINNLAVSGQTAAQQYAILQTIGSGYDLCLIQVGVNDIQGATSFSGFVSTIQGMVNYAKSIGAQPIVALPTSFYSKAEAIANGQSGGQNTSNNAAIHSYRAVLARAVADAGGLLNLETMKGYGAMTAKWLSLTPYAVSDSIVADNIHPTPYGSMMLAQGWARSVLGWLCRPDTTNSEPFEAMPSSWLSSGFGLLNTPNIRGREFSGILSLHATNNNDGTVAFTLPPSFKISNVVMKTVTAINASNLPAGVCNMYVGTDGKCYFFNLSGTTTKVSLDGIRL